MHELKQKFAFREHDATTHPSGALQAFFNYSPTLWIISSSEL